ncbi:MULTISPECIES: hypothetical protein [Gracilimonas]|uniref:DUF2892 domain-containing protein n=1 Tax=Gracilimonas sediminicola TaxID=2952158 RepID=A0A9X2REB2_9BACT|nr:hypothetical protein [Gracilimonas sediminicola]MCP9290128.1 hypothetical protein [Gracilimonas sediminicola]
MSSKNILFTNWHAMRWVALGIAVFFATLAIIDREIITGMLAAFFLFQAVTNKGCMVSPSCGIPVDENQTSFKEYEEPDFTEIK